MLKNMLKRIFLGRIIPVLIMFGFMFFCGSFQNIFADEWSDEQIVNAIFKAEGGYLAEYLYGIRSVSYDTEAEARRICFNTVRNNRKRFADYGHEQFDSYLEFLASRYCPVNAENDPNGLNDNWLSNVNYFLARGEI